MTPSTPLAATAPTAAAFPALMSVEGLPAMPQELSVTQVPAAPSVGIATVVGHGAHMIQGRLGDDKTRKAFEKLKAAGTDEDKDNARDDLRSALESEYDKYLETQEQELSKMEDKLKELRSQLRKRREAKDDLVELRLKTLENDASGLGWPGGESNNLFWHVAPASALGGGMTWSSEAPSVASGQAMSGSHGVTGRAETVIVSPRRSASPSVSAAAGPIRERIEIRERNSGDSATVESASDEEAEEAQADNEKSESKKSKAKTSENRRRKSRDDDNN